MQKDKEPNELQKLRKRVRVLEESLADADAEERLSRAYFDLLCKDLRVDAEAYKKKHAGMPSISRLNMKSEEDG